MFFGYWKQIHILLNYKPNQFGIFFFSFADIGVLNLTISELRLLGTDLVG